MGVWEVLGEPNHHDRLLNHPGHTVVARAIGALLGELRGTEGFRDLRRVQDFLFSELTAAERHFNDARRAARKARQADTADVHFWRAAINQLRSVGDAIAWRFLDYDRQLILLLGQNQEPGHMTKKSGTVDEWHVFNRHWDAGEPALMCALTRAITVTDLIVRPSGRELVLEEVKRQRSSRRRDQTDLLELVVRQATREPSFETVKGKGWFLRTDVPLRSHWQAADGALSDLMRTGVAAWVPNPGVRLIMFAPFHAKYPSVEDLHRRYDEAWAATEGQVSRMERRIVGHSLEYPYLRSRVAPFGIFPLPLAQTIELVAGEIIFGFEIDLDYMVERLAAVDVEAEVVMPVNGGQATKDTPLFRVAGGNRRGTLYAGLVEPLGIELVEADTWAQAVASASFPPGTESTWLAEICFGDEAAVWR